MWTTYVEAQQVELPVEAGVLLRDHDVAELQRDAQRACAGPVAAPRHKKK